MADNRQLEISFVEGGNSADFVGNGWSKVEPHGRWTDGNEARITLPELTLGRQYKLSMTLAPFLCPPKIGAQDLFVFANGTMCFSARIINARTVTFPIPDEALKASRRVELRLMIPTAVSPAAVGQSADRRSLGISLSRLKIEAETVLSNEDSSPQFLTTASYNDDGRYPQADLAICAIFKNEERYIYEWLSFHDFIGVKKFYLYNNNSDDDSVKVIRSWPYQEKICLQDWPVVPGQNAAYRHMLERHRNAAKWCAFIDCDEFLVPQTPTSISDILEYFENKCSALYVHWLMFGSSGQVELQPGLVTERFVWRAYNSFSPHKIGKTIVQLQHARDVAFCHIVKSDGAMINDSLQVIDQSSSGIHLDHSHRYLALNHYFTKSLAEWRQRRGMGKADKVPDDPAFRRTEEEFSRHDQNVVEDTKAKLIATKMKSHYYNAEPNIDASFVPNST